MISEIIFPESRRPAKSLVRRSRETKPGMWRSGYRVCLRSRRSRVRISASWKNLLTKYSYDSFAESILLWIFCRILGTRIFSIAYYNSAPQMHQKWGSVKLNHLLVIWCALKLVIMIAGILLIYLFKKRKKRKKTVLYEQTVWSENRSRDAFDGMKRRKGYCLPHPLVSSPFSRKMPWPSY